MISACLAVKLIDLKICPLANLDLHNQRNLKSDNPIFSMGGYKDILIWGPKNLGILCLMTLYVMGVLSLILDLIYFFQDSTVIGSNCTADKDCVAGTSLPVGNGKPLREIQNYLLPYLNIIFFMINIVKPV